VTPTQAKSISLNGMALRRLLKFQSDLDNIIQIQCSHGNWNCSAYMMGLANGLIMANSIMTGEAADFLEAPEEWLDDLNTDDFAPTEGSVASAQLLLAEVK